MSQVKRPHWLTICGVALGALSLLLAFSQIFPARAHAAASLGPKPGAIVLRSGANAVSLAITPNSASDWNIITAMPTRSGRPIADAKVSLSMTMTAMAMGTSRYRMTQVRRGVYRFNGPGMVMSGPWALQIDVKPHDGHPFTVGVRDQVGG